MVLPLPRNIVWVLIAVAALFTLSGCTGDPFKIQLVNGSAWPITEVLVYPVPDGCEAPGPDAQLNRLPTDGSGTTMALLPNDEVLLPWIFPKDVYEVAVTFYDSANQSFRRVQAPYPYDLTFVKGGYPVVLRTVMDTDNTPQIEIEFTTRF